jgi:uncharacterized membrane protein (DUF106 family)
MYVVIFGILGYLFRSKVSNRLWEVTKVQVKEDLKEVKNQNKEMREDQKEHGKLLSQIMADLKWLKKQNGGRA